MRLLLLTALVLLLPEPAYAWGPAAHLEFSLTLLKDMTLLLPAVAVLLRRFPDDFLYGSIAADITVAKNLSPYHLHCHNWQVGFSVLELAKEDSTRAFAWGYLSHLAADVVAHNYFVPYKTVEDFRRRSAPHMYWEMRFDTQVPPEVWEAARNLSTIAFGRHDRHLRHILTGTLLPFRVNKQIFNSMVLFNRFLRWERMARAHARRSPVDLNAEEMKELRKLSMEHIIDVLSRGSVAHCLNSDPTGHRNLLLARDLRKRLKKLVREKRLLESSDAFARIRPLFLEAMGNKILLPSMKEFTDPSATFTPRERRSFQEVRRKWMQRLKRKRSAKS